VSTAEVAVHGSPAYLREARKAKWLSWASLGYMALEGAVAVVAGIVAGSIALIGFGIDSAIEGFASVIIVWRFTGWRTLSHEAEERAQKLVAVQFFILAPYVGIESVRALIEGHHPEESVVGIALAASSLVAMPWLGWAKQRIAARIGSSATASEGSRTCSAPTSPGRCSSVCSGTPCSGPGGSMLSWGS
jgi:divalent metal cation (Fe/Co/Zn/Cd) transporter